MQEIYFIQQDKQGKGQGWIGDRVLTLVCEIEIPFQNKYLSKIQT
jgi:hypothetical protein